MTTSTARYRFEYRIFDWAERFSGQICGNRRAFFIGLRQDGSVRRVYFAQGGDPFDGKRKDALAAAYSTWFLYSPYSDQGSGYVEWFELDLEVVERWLQAILDATDFADVRSTGSRDGWPRSWRMIVG
jgi:hypothetical protein